MNCCTGGAPGSRRRGTGQRPISNSRFSHGMSRQASRKKNWSWNGVVSKCSVSERTASEWSVWSASKPGVTSALSSRPATRAVSPWPEK